MEERFGKTPTAVKTPARILSVGTGEDGEDPAICQSPGAEV